MMTFKTFCEQNNYERDQVFSLVVGEGGGILPMKTGMTGYFGVIEGDSIIAINDKLGVKKEIPFSSFSRAEFGIGSGNLWLQCVIDGKPFAFCMPRKEWKSPSAKLLMEKIGSQTEILDMKAYNQFTGKLFLLYALIK